MTFFILSPDGENVPRMGHTLFVSKTGDIPPIDDELPNSANTSVALRYCFLRGSLTSGSGTPQQFIYFYIFFLFIYFDCRSSYF